MKKNLLFFIILITLFLTLAACQEDILTYDNPGTITITITNSEINAEDVTVTTTNDESEVLKDGKVITINEERMLRDMITLEVEGYIGKNILIQSSDYSTECKYDTSITFEESYISMELTIITEALSEDIEIESDEIISIESKGNVYDIKLTNSGIPEINISAGSEYKDYTIILNSSEIQKCISSRTIMLLNNDYVLVELELDSNTQAYANSYSSMSVESYNKGMNYVFGLPKDGNAYIYVRTRSGEYFGEFNLTPEDMEEEDIFILTLDDILVNVTYNIYPFGINYMNIPYWYVLAEKVGENYIPIYSYCTNSPNLQRNSLLSLDKEYYVFTMSADAKIRYKELNVSEAPVSYGSRNINLQFVEADPIRNVQVKIIDLHEETEDFTGVGVSSICNDSNQNQNLGTISSGDSLSINPSNNYLGMELTNLPIGYSQLNYQISSDNLEIINNLATNGIFEVYVYHSFDLYLHIDSTESYENDYVYNYSDSSQYYIDSENNVMIPDFVFNDNYSLYIDYNYHPLRNLIGNFNNIVSDELGDYHVTVIIN